MITATDLEVPFPAVGGHLALNFVNTVNARSNEFPHPVTNERLKNYIRLVGWGRKMGILNDTEVEELLKEAELNPAGAEATLSRAISFREAIYRIFVSIEADLSPAAADLGVLNDALPEALAQLQIVPEGQGFGWGWKRDRVRLDQMLWPVARAAAELLVSDQLKKVRRCGGENCGWLFLDLSRNHSRQWCDMKDCGNRAKARRHYQRKRQAPALEQ